MRIAIIAGTGFEKAFGTEGNYSTVRTPYGDVVVDIHYLNNGELVILPRHGFSHSTPPHMINHWANIWAFKELGVSYVIATSAVGSLRKDRSPGDMVIIDDMIDFRGQVTTFFNGENLVVRHTDFSVPFSPLMRRSLIQTAIELNEKEIPPVAVYEDGTYLCVSGPRYETPSEVRLFGSWGADVVGMTVAPEAILAHEIGLEYAAVSVVTNLATGLSDKPLFHADVNRQMESSSAFLVNLLYRTTQTLLEELQLN